jgi:hypothetical protein
MTKEYVTKRRLAEMDRRQVWYKCYKLWQYKSNKALNVLGVTYREVIATITAEVCKDTITAYAKSPEGFEHTETDVYAISIPGMGLAIYSLGHNVNTPYYLLNHNTDTSLRNDLRRKAMKTLNVLQSSGDSARLIVSLDKDMRMAMSVLTTLLQIVEDEEKVIYEDQILKDFAPDISYLVGPYGINTGDKNIPLRDDPRIQDAINLLSRLIAKLAIFKRSQNA